MNIQTPEYIQLPKDFFEYSSPTPVPNPEWVVFNDTLCQQLGASPETLKQELFAFAGNQPLFGISPISQAYAGHQFGHFTTLGDGRAHIIGEIQDPQGKLWEIQLKGSGPTRFSRGGDGRATLKPMLREYLISEALHALGIPTTRTLGVIRTGEWVARERPTQGAIAIRVASSHLRVGTFQYAAMLNDKKKLQTLADWAIERHSPECKSSADKYLQLLKRVVQKQAQLVAHWMGVGFIHGVMNTDNMTISGESIDFGPCAFMDVYDPSTVFSSIDHQGRYAYGNQPSIAQWNLARLGEALLPLLHKNPDNASILAKDVVETFSEEFQTQYFQILHKKLGFQKNHTLESNTLFQKLFQWMYENQQDMTETFATLTWSPLTQEKDSLLELSSFLQLWENLLRKENSSLQQAQIQMQKVNPTIIPRNHLVESALIDAESQSLHNYFQILEATRNPFSNDKKYSVFHKALKGHSQKYVTYCGT